MSIYKKSSSPGNDHIHSTFAAVLDFVEQHEHTKTLKSILPLFKRYSFFVYTTAKSLCVHSLHHTLITAARRIGISPWTIKTVADHSNGSCLTGVFIHHNLKELTQAPFAIIETLQRGNY